MKIAEFRSAYPQYDDLSDFDLSRNLYDKYYKNQMTFQQFGRLFGLDESLTEQGAAATFTNEYSKGVFRGFLNVASGLVGTTEWIIPGRQETLVEAKRRILRARERFNPTHEGAAAWSGRVLGETIPFMATAMAGGYVGGATFGTLGKSAALGQSLGAGGVAFAVEGDMAYESAKNQGAAEFQAQTERVLVGSINAYLETLQIKKLIGFHKAGKHSFQGFVRNIRNKAWNLIGGDISNFTGEILKLAVEEGLQEATQEGVSIGVPAALREEYPKLPDGTPDYRSILTQIGEAGLGGAFAGVVLGGAGAFISATPSIAAPTRLEIQKTVDAINNSKLSEIEKTHLLRELDKITEGIDEIGQKLAPEDLTPTEIFKNKMDDIVQDVEQIRSIEEAEISRERARRFEEFRKIKESVADPRQRIAIAKAELKGRLKKQITPLQEKFTSEEIDNAFDTITESTILTEGEQISAVEGIEKLLFDGAIPALHELAALQRANLLSKQAIQNILKNRTAWQKMWARIKDLSFAPWSILTSIDLSAGGRQGWKVLFRDPKLWFKSVARGYRMFASEDYFNYIELKRKTHPFYNEAIRRGIEETTIDSITRGEEVFASNMIQKIPGIRASARGFIGTINELRFGWYFKGKQLSEGSGMTAQQQKELATIANDITGRGKLPKALKKIQSIGLPFFAPRLFMGLVRTPLDLFSVNEIKQIMGDIKRGEVKTLGDISQRISPARKMLAGTLASFIAFTLATLYLLDRDDKDKIDVEWNPLSSDFLKVRHGKTRIDILSGYQPIIRVIAQFFMGKRKATETGRIYETERTEIIARFLQSKLSPHAGLAVDLWRGETFLGKKLRLAPGDISEQFYQRLAPLFIQDVIDAIHYQGLPMAGAIAPLAWHGLGVQTYPTTLTQDVTALKNRLSKQYFGVDWDEVGPEAQKAMREYNPHIGLMESEAKIDREDFDFIGKILSEADKTGRKIQRKLLSNIQNELKKYVIDIGNIGRNVGSSWYLNDKRYKTYQKELSIMLNKYLGLLINHPDYKAAPNEVKREVLQDAIDEIKKEGRMRLITQANYTDLQRREQLR